MLPLSLKSTAPIQVDMVRTYLHEIGRVPLLTYEQEVRYGKQVQGLMRLLEKQQQLANKLHREPTEMEWADAVNMSIADLRATLHQGTVAKRKMIEANLRLVVSIAKKYQKRNLEYRDWEKIGRAHV